MYTHQNFLSFLALILTGITHGPLALLFALLQEATSRDLLNTKNERIASLAQQVDDEMLARKKQEKLVKELHSAMENATHDIEGFRETIGVQQVGFAM